MIFVAIFNGRVKFIFKRFVDVDLDQPDSEVVYIGEEKGVPIVARVKGLARGEPLPVWQGKEGLEGCMAPKRE